MAVETNHQIPQHFKKFPSKMPFNRVHADDVIAVNADGTEHKIYNKQDANDEFCFLSTLRYYGGVSGGMNVNASSYTELFSIHNDKGGFIPVVVFPALNKGASGSIKITIDGRITEIDIPPNNNSEWRSVIGGFFPLTQRPDSTDTSARVTFLERRSVHITNPAEELERCSPGLYFEKDISVSFLGDCFEDHHGRYTCFSLVKFT